MVRGAFHIFGVYFRHRASKTYLATQNQQQTLGQDTHHTLCSLPVGSIGSGWRDAWVATHRGHKPYLTACPFDSHTLPPSLRQRCSCGEVVIITEATAGESGPFLGAVPLSPTCWETPLRILPARPYRVTYQRSSSPSLRPCAIFEPSARRPIRDASSQREEGPWQ